MAVDLDTLKQLQKFDKEIFDLTDEKERIPQEISDEEEKLAAQQARVSDAEEKVKESRLSLNKKELELKEKEEQIVKYDAQLSQVKTNKEYSALQSEIMHIKADNSLLEEDIIRLLDEVQKAEEIEKNEKAVLAEREKERAQKKKELEERVKHHEARIAELRTQRETCIKTVDQKIAAIYERLAENRRGVALSSVHDRSCGVCQMKLLSQTLNEVMIGKNLVFCESCGRILYLA